MSNGTITNRPASPLITCIGTYLTRLTYRNYPLTSVAYSPRAMSHTASKQSDDGPFRCRDLRNELVCNAKSRTFVCFLSS